MELQFCQVVLGMGSILAKSQTVELTEIRATSWLSSFFSGLLITLSDPKAIFFYMGFFPAFIDLDRISIIDVSILIAIAIVAVGGSKLIYAYMADRSRLFLQNSQAKKVMNLIAGGVTIATGIFLIFKT